MGVKWCDGRKYWITESKSISHYANYPTKEDDEESDNFNQYNGVFDKEYRMPWWVERYVHALDARQEEREYELKTKKKGKL